ncbi:MAG: hypothetical protein M3Y58_17275, partial [Chloroflexota bacterium]|nr:hypothetical protein [Chloroflexota bacterium]
MPSSAVDETNVTETTPLPKNNRTRRLVALYAILALLAVVAGVVVGVHRHNAATSGTIAAPTAQSLVATALPGLPTPTPLANRPSTPTAVPTAVPPTEPPTALPPTDPPATTVPPTAPPEPPPSVVAAPVQPAPAVTTNQ